MRERLQRQPLGHGGNLYVSLPYENNLELVNVCVQFFLILPVRLYYIGD
jgi:hypothetical protein